MKKKTEYYPDVDVVIQHVKEKNPDIEMTKASLSKDLGLGKQILTDWKAETKKPPKWAKTVVQLCKLMGVKPLPFIKSRKV